jgi:hypothetical protein
MEIETPKELENALKETGYSDKASEAITNWYTKDLP